MFSSGVTADPRPWLEMETNRRYSMAEHARGVAESRCWFGLVYDPRPEYDLPISNAKNPILEAFRQMEPVRPVREAAARGWARYMCAGTHSLGKPITPEHKAHARKVFTRLAAFTKES